MRLFVIFYIISSLILAGLAYCHRHDPQALRQVFQDKQGVSLLEELK